MSKFGPSLKDDSHLEGLDFSKVITEPNENRGPLDCDGEVWNICQPCGIRCDEMMCSNQMCSIACLDQDFMNRTEEPNKDRHTNIILMSQKLWLIIDESFKKP